MNHQGEALTPAKVERIKVLLETSKLTMPEIADRMGVADSTVVRINKEHRVRDYHGRRWSWTLVSHT